MPSFVVESARPRTRCNNYEASCTSRVRIANGWQHSASTTVDGPNITTTGSTVLELLHRGSRKRFRPREGMNELAFAQERLVSTISNMWANQTWEGRRQLWSRYQAFCLRNEIHELDAQSAALFVVSTETSPATQLTYSASLASLLRHCAVPPGPLTLLNAGLRAMGANVPTHQAIPWTKPAFLRWCGLQEASLQPALFLAWKTASRWDEIQRLVKEDIIVLTPESLVVKWGSHTKTSRCDPFQPHLYTHVVGHLTAEIVSAVSRLRPHELLTCVSTQRLNQLLQGTGMSAHSIKRGAMTHLAPLVANGQLEVGLLSRLAKHQSQCELSNTTIRYLGDPVSTAKMLRTSEATNLL